MDKTQVPPSGDKHDFLGLAEYWWPNPNTADGLPYVYRDGQINPEYKTIPDRDYLQKLITATSDLSAAYYFTGQTKYSDKAALMIRTWFVNPATRMNPNLQYTAVVKGVNNGSSIGIIAGSFLPKLVDAFKILQTSPSLTPTDQYIFGLWGRAYYTWLTTSVNGLKEATSANNHGTYYNVQVTSFAELIGNHAGALAAINKGKALINSQIRSDGIQPLEMARATPWAYHTLNLGGLISIAQIAKREGVDLWNYTAPLGGSIHKAVDFLEPYANGSQPWPYPDIDATWRPWLMLVSLRQAATAYNNPTYSADATLSTASNNPQRDYSLLLY